MINHEQDKWNQRYSRQTDNAPVPVQVLENNVHLLPIKGKALDLACGRGGNAICLAETGLETHAWDISDVAISQLADFADKNNLKIQIDVRDVMATSPSANSFDVIVVSRFLERSLIPMLKQATRPGGMIFYQTFVTDKVSDTGPSNPDYLLKQNELLSLFQDWVIRVYREEGCQGDTSAGFRNEAQLVAQKPI